MSVAKLVSDYLPELQAATTTYGDRVDRYGHTWLGWASSNPGEKQGWDAYLAALVAGERPAPPAFKTHFGKALLAAAALAIECDPPPPPPARVAAAELVFQHGDAS